MTIIKTANFLPLKGAFTLPSVRKSDDVYHLRADEVIYAELPSDVVGDGLLSFVYSTSKGVDSGIDVAFKVTIGTATYSWQWLSAMYAGIQIPVGGLKSGQNILRFTATKGGTVTEPNPNEYLSGKGLIHFDSVCLTYHRNITV